ncbi:Site-specific recombinase XerC [Frankineae bacterium MT45]|nr:Site-specific recombinase XerC [Frankineae bacterium MT45]
MSRRANGEGSVYRRKDGRWEGAAWLLDSAGNRKRIRVYGSTRTEAHSRLIEKLHSANHGVPVPERSWRLADYFDYWLPIVRKTRKPTTYLLYKGVVENHLRSGIGGKSLSSLSVTELQRHLQRELDAGKSIRTVQKQRTVLSAALTRAQREELVVRNVAHHVELPTYRRQEIHPWSAEQVATFLKVASDEPFYPILLLVALYGLRRGEVLGLRWLDIDFEEERIHVRQQLQRYDRELHVGPLKTNAGCRDLPLLGLAREALLAHRPNEVSDDALVFLSKFGNPIEPGNVLRAFKRISKHNGLPTITLHQLRHTTATLLKNTGLPTRDAQLVLGHANITTTQQLYQHADISGQVRALEQLQDVLVGDGRRSRRNQPSSGRNGNDFRMIQSGGSSQTRTGDTRLFSFTGVSVPQSLTDVKLFVRQRMCVLLLGGAAVICSRQVALPTIDRHANSLSMQLNAKTPGNVARL